MNNLDKMNDARLQNQLEKLYHFSEVGIMSLKDFFVACPPTFKKIYIQDHAKKKIHLEYTNC